MHVTQMNNKKTIIFNFNVLIKSSTSNYLSKQIKKKSSIKNVITIINKEIYSFKIIPINYTLLTIVV